ncbi:MAG: hypothetical protein VKO65_05705 [Cyanobacteriota bacterium]|nr:hypothetical protein [Cyanobacteriota bacterium]
MLLLSATMNCSIVSISWLALQTLPRSITLWLRLPRPMRHPSEPGGSVGMSCACQ